MVKISRAKKTSNKKSSKAARRALLASKLSTSNEKDVQCAQKDFDENSEWEIEVILVFDFFLVVINLLSFSTIVRSSPDSTSAGEIKRHAIQMDLSANSTTSNQVRFFSQVTACQLFSDNEHRIWIKWTVAFNDKIRWPAEKQGKISFI